MQIERTRIEQAARATGIDIDDLAAFFAEGEERIYAPGEWLFQESTPRRWAGILLAGEDAASGWLRAALRDGIAVDDLRRWIFAPRTTPPIAAADWAGASSRPGWTGSIRAPSGCGTSRTAATRRP